MHPLQDLPRERIPRHIAIIMDGNGRWAVRQGLERIKGHERGAEVVPDLVTECVEMRRQLGGPDVITIYSFSVENWKRPADEVEALMQMYVDYLRRERPRMMRENVRFMQIGRSDELPELLQEELAITLEETGGNDGLVLNLALNYGSRTEITDAVTAIARKVAAGELLPGDIDQHTIDAHLYTADLPDPDLLIRTAGELRISNYLLWQISYAELFISDALWPEFDAAELHRGIRAFAARNRRFGALDRTNTLQPV
ncbi:MAG: polyprenyl diphosphate synthase [Planctomycetota bacterium]